MNTYITLKVGDVRQREDQQRMIDTGRGKWSQPSRSHYQTHTELQPGAWGPTSLPGHPVLPSDLCHLEFRRPV